ncbi:BadF/BadG/BcrA/BcrD ATPase family protein, partial [candidate division CSSED10-310 bacterium]
MFILGIDIGAISVAWALIDSRNNVVEHDYQFHHGQIETTLKNSLMKLDLSRITAVAITDSSPPIIKNSVIQNTQIAVSQASRFYNPSVRSILMVGGENFGLITFDEQGKYKSYKGNSACAAGTGAFLDQQAIRLGLEGTYRLAELAEANTENIPHIATRCAVFAKTDLIHAQQEGYSQTQICDGLTQGLAQNIIDTLIGDKTISLPLSFTGGVSKNRAVVRHIENLLSTKVIIDEFSHIYGAIGAAFIQLKRDNSTFSHISGLEDLIEHKKSVKSFGYPALSLKFSQYPVFDSEQRFNFKSNVFNTSMEVEVDIYENLKNLSNTNVILGIDIGSTSTKAIIINEDKAVLIGLYTRTAGAPIQAIQLILEAIWNIIEHEGIQLHFIGTG